MRLRTLAAGLTALVLAVGVAMSAQGPDAPTKFQPPKLQPKKLQPKLQPKIDPNDIGLYPTTGSDFGQLYPNSKWSPPDTQTMQNGVKTKSGAGYAMSIAIPPAGNNVIAHHCTAVYVGNRIVVTAGHCLRGKDPSGLTVAYGSLNLNEAQPASVVELACNDSLDVGLLVLKDGVKVSPATLVAPKKGAAMTAYGWGTATPSLIGKKGLLNSPDLLQVTMTTVDSAGACVTSAAIVCAQALGAGPCSKDSGGPLASSGGSAVSGILTTADGCPRPAKAMAEATYASGDMVDAWVKEAMALPQDERQAKYSCK